MGFRSSLDLRDAQFFFLYGPLVGKRRQTQQAGHSMVSNSIAIEHRLESGILLRQKHRHGAFGYCWFVAERTTYYC